MEEAYIYGSWAARYRGEAGPIPNDIDVLVIGDVDEDEVFDAARDVERVLGREVNVRRLTSSAWHGGGDEPFLASVRSRPLVAIELEGSSGEVGSGAGIGRRHDHPA